MSAVATWEYEALDARDTELNGALDAATADDVALRLVDMGLRPVAIRQQNSRAIQDRFTARLQRPDYPGLLMFTRVLRAMLASGIPIQTALSTIETQVAKQKIAAMVRDIRRAIEAGSALSGALASQGRAVPRVYWEMISAGEEAGQLDEVLAWLGKLLEHEIKIRRTMKTALRYPAMVIAAVFFAGLVVLMFVVPRFASLFATMGADLPLPTRVLVGAGDLLANHSFAMMLGLAVVVAVLFWGASTKLGKWYLASTVLRIPVIGSVVTQLELARVSFILEVLFRSGIPTVRAVELAGRTASNPVIESELGVVAHHIAEGGGLGGSFGASDIFPPVFVQLLSVGEESGSLEPMLADARQFLEDEAEVSVNNLTALVEPVLTVFVAALVVGLALAIFLPMWNMPGHML